MRQIIGIKLLLAQLVFVATLHAQDVGYAKKVIGQLCSPAFYGRGYVNQGDKIAADYIKKEIELAGASPFNANHFQPFTFEVNAFAGEVSFVVDNHSLIPGEHFIVSAGCPAFSGNFALVWVDSSLIDNQASFQKLQKSILRNSFIVLNLTAQTNLLHPERLAEIENNQLKAKGIIYLNQQKLTWSVSLHWDKFVKIYVKPGLLKPYQLFANITVESALKTHHTQNIIAYIEGAKQKDSFVVFTAHYDHLGMMGKEAIFPGANDNASGVAMLLDLLRYYKKHKPNYSIAFIFFAGEEAGLIGSYYYTQNPIFPLKKIAMLLNLDLMGTGDKGLTAVNATLYTNEFEDLQLANVEGDYLPVIAPRGKAQNSDHYYFTEQGVKSFFFYLMGNYPYYHDVEDRAEVLPLSKYTEAFKLITHFVDGYQKK